MKKKELKNLATKIAKLEKIIQTSSNKKEVARAENEITKLIGSVTSIEEATLIDELVMDLLEKN